MATLIEAAGVEIESVWTTIFAKALEGKNLGDFLFNIGSGAAAPAAGGKCRMIWHVDDVAAAPAAGGAAAPAKEEKKKEEVKEESDDDMGFGLFD